MGKMKELSMYIEEVIKLLTRLADDVHIIAEDVKRRQEKEKRTIRKQIKQDREKPTWGRLI